MRQYLYPLRQARYVIGDELKELKKSGANVQRNSTFQSLKKPKHDPTAPKEALTGALKRVAIDAIDQVRSESREPSQKQTEIVRGGRSNFHLHR